jgi:DNA-binding beta-propeller fold protein YncE
LGATVNASLITGLDLPNGIAVSGGSLFVTDTGGNTISEYTPSGATVNASLITGLYFPSGIVVTGGNLFVMNQLVTNNPPSGTIGEYTTSGTTVNASLITGLNGPVGIAVVPEPTTFALGILGALSLFAFRRRLHRKRLAALSA